MSPEFPNFLRTIVATTRFRTAGSQSTPGASIASWAGAVVLFGMVIGLGGPVAAEPALTETIVMIRHGEKPDPGLGQLTCQGLNRALALPAVIAREFGKPAVIFAPNPGETKTDNGTPYNYVRPLATIEPVAIAFGLPVDTSIGVSNIAALHEKLDDRIYWNSLVLIAWEHNDIVSLSRLLMADHGGNPNSVPGWKGTDFDSIYVIRITRTGEASMAEFEHRYENLNGEPASCPGQTQ